jgi:hypothetical protein
MAADRRGPGKVAGTDARRSSKPNEGSKSKSEVAGCEGVEPQPVRAQDEQPASCGGDLGQFLRGASRCEGRHREVRWRARPACAPQQWYLLLACSLPTGVIAAPTSLRSTLSSAGWIRCVAAAPALEAARGVLRRGCLCAGFFPGHGRTGLIIHLFSFPPFSPAFPPPPPPPPPNLPHSRAAKACTRWTLLRSVT